MCVQQFFLRAMMVLILVMGILVPATRAIVLYGDIIAHDPSRIIKDGDSYYVYTTGNDIPMLTSTDRIHWKRGQVVLPNGTPAWARKIVPENDGHNIWAPDIIEINGLFYLYYAISGGKTSASIGLVTSLTLDPSAANYKWTDRGEVIGNTAVDRYSTIDPAPFLDIDGNLWLSWGSGYVYQYTDPEIFLIKLDKNTGLRDPTDSKLYPVVDGHVEASYVYLNNGFYYLFWNTGGCCNGVNSTYLIHTARSSSITGPYVDKNGKPASSVTFLSSHGNVHGPGHMGVLNDGSMEYFSYHYYNASGVPVLGEDVLEWGSDGWPVAGN